MRKLLLIILLLFTFSAYGQSYVSGDRQPMLFFSFYSAVDTAVAFDFQLNENGSIIITRGELADTSISLIGGYQSRVTINMLAGLYNINIKGDLDILRFFVIKSSTINSIVLNNIYSLRGIYADDDGHNLSRIDINNLPSLVYVHLSYNKLSVEEVSNLLIKIDEEGIHNQFSQFESQNQTPTATPNAAGQTAKTNLISKGWTVTTD